MDVPDPGWKLDPDRVADASAAERYCWGDAGQVHLRRRRGGAANPIGHVAAPRGRAGAEQRLEC